VLGFLNKHFKTNVIIHELTKDKSDREIARICQVSAPFVASVRNPEVKERQAKRSSKLHSVRRYNKRRR
jgi:hypothetical protein